MYNLLEVEAASGGQCERETLRTWRKRYNVALASDDALAGRHRRYTELDAVRLAIVCRLTRYGLTPRDAFEVVEDQHRQIERAIATIPQDTPDGDLETRTAARLERRRTDVFVLIRKGGAEVPDLESFGIAGLDAVGWRFVHPAPDAPCLSAALVLNITEIAQQVTARLRTLQRIRNDVE